jgi:hypothetical protein
MLDSKSPFAVAPTAAFQEKIQKIITSMEENHIPEAAINATLVATYTALCAPSGNISTALEVLDTHIKTHLPPNPLLATEPAESDRLEASFAKPLIDGLEHLATSAKFDITPSSGREFLSTAIRNSFVAAIQATSPLRSSPQKSTHTYLAESLVQNSHKTGHSKLANALYTTLQERNVEVAPPPRGPQQSPGR